MDKLKYALLTEATGRWEANIIENFLKADGIDAILVQEAVSHSTHPTSFATVKIYVPKSSIRQARSPLRNYRESNSDSKEKSDMTSKKKMEAKLEAKRKARQARYFQIAGVVVALLVVVLGIWMFVPKGSDAGDQTACAPFADIPAAAQYDEPPMRIDTSKQYFATVKMATGGEFVMQLYPDKAPVTVNSFVFLSCKGYFNGVTFHRVLEGFMAQGGDPTGAGTGGPGYEFVNEDSDLTFDKEGVVAMANAGRDTNGSQFFITFGAQEFLNGGYTIFGQVVQGMDVVNGITRRDPEQFPDFPGDAMESVIISVQ